VNLLCRRHSDGRIGPLIMLLPRDSGPLPWIDPRDTSTGDRRSALSSDMPTSSHIGAFRPSWPQERRIRRQIDRAVGRALVDDGFAARLLAEPALAVDADVCGQAHCRDGCCCRAEDLADFARQMITRFWGPAQGAVPAPQPTMRRQS
jgi:hypothetical protein